MKNLTDELSEQDWLEARSWVDRLKERPDSEDLVTEFEEWLGELPERAAAYRKIVETLALLPLLESDARAPGVSHCPGSTQRAKNKG